MPNIEIRAIEGQERADVAHFLGGYAFDPSPPLPERTGWDRALFHLRNAIYLALYEDGRPVATAAASPMTQGVRGHIYNVGAVWGVATHPEARRKGYARQVLSRLFVTMRDAGMPLSCLYPFRESFYDQLGYTNFPQTRRVRFSPNSLLPLLKLDLAGRVELLTVAEGLDAYRAYLREQQGRQHGMGLFSDAAAERTREDNKDWVALAKVDGQIVGAMLYRMKGESDELEMIVNPFYYSDSRGLYLLLEWFARHADHARQIEIKLPPGELPETWFPDMNIQLGGFEPPMGRVLDVAEIGGMHTDDGRFSARICDPHCAWNNNSYLFETVDGRLHVSITQQADCDLSIQGLSALVYGTHSTDNFGVRGWGNPSHEVQATMQAMFPRALPYLHEVF